MQRRSSFGQRQTSSTAAEVLNESPRDCTVTIDHFNAPRDESLPKAMNVTLPLDEALRLHLGLGQLLGQLNSYNRATKAGRQSAVNLCVHTDQRRITINEGRIRGSE